ncbi:SpoIIE family protein phosphatase [Yinghuangia sp. ASG 101]|uniref:PP2C family protein-serine/threonine phosphatase n=1 Tax=Yinghuangia sp. ASG 101 TaxID=2896848 RepID=UPI001E5AC2A7|nr:PP2C family protein-serine/threonine phosphatase [Yinghuangia sp. ASG 101]UGQ10613.1 SpoIIE family protein phosphatase [Yinghuangia sp. ASG 101]
MHERTGFDAAELTSMMTRVARLRSQVDDLLAGYVSQESTRQAHVCELLAASLEQSLGHLGRLCATAPSGDRADRANTPFPKGLSTARIRSGPVDGIVGDTLAPDRLPAPHDLLPPRDGTLTFGRVRESGLDNVVLPAPRANTGLLASAQWHLDTDEIRWSGEMYQIFDRDPLLGPLRLDDLPGRVVAGDVPALERFVADLLVELCASECELGVLRPNGTTRALHLLGEPVLDVDGSARSIWIIARDVSELRWTQAALSETREQLLVQRRLARAEHRLATELQRVVMPRWTRAIVLPGLEIATHYSPAEATARVGGDWYDGMALPDRSVLVTLGDVSGHGLAAASGMTTLRSALAGLAVTGAAPGAMLYWLNRLLLQALPTEAIATALCGRYDPEHRVLTWARAGHPPPLLFRDGRGTVPDAPDGIALGAHDEPSYDEARLELRSGDLLLLFTDGLVEHRGRDVDEAIDVLLGLAPLLCGADARSCVDLVVSRLGPTDYEDDACVMALRVT